MNAGPSPSQCPAFTKPALYGLVVNTERWSASRVHRRRGASYDRSMNSDPRECRREDGRSKLGFASKRQAKLFLRRSSGDVRGYLSIYRCGTCDQFHLGTDKYKLAERRKD